MTENFNYLFYFLDKEQIAVDKTEFLFQIQSYPDYPSLLSISDTLTFFNLDNGAIRVDFIDLELFHQGKKTLIQDHIFHGVIIVQKIVKNYFNIATTLNNKFFVLF